ncbi:hypothetical protein [Lysinibacillus xylanilyticus]|uniref:hypothetical protein n=1 Tax=Lysinibacillus xylanilyticus TaxID=582475 RepID=UPI003D02CEDD
MKRLIFIISSLVIIGLLLVVTKVDAGESAVSQVKEINIEQQENPEFSDGINNIGLFLKKLYNNDKTLVFSYADNPQTLSIEDMENRFNEIKKLYTLDYKITNIIIDENMNNYFIIKLHLENQNKEIERKIKIEINEYGKIMKEEVI